MLIDLTLRAFWAVQGRVRESKCKRKLDTLQSHCTFDLILKKFLKLRFQLRQSVLCVSKLFMRWITHSPATKPHESVLGSCAAWRFDWRTVRAEETGGTLQTTRWSKNQRRRCWGERLLLWMVLRWEVTVVVVKNKVIAVVCTALWCNRAHDTNEQRNHFSARSVLWFWTTPVFSRSCALLQKRWTEVKVHLQLSLLQNSEFARFHPWH